MFDMTLNHVVISGFHSKTTRASELMSSSFPLWEAGTPLSDLAIRFRGFLLEEELKWFKHDANASIDSKLQRIKLKYGMEGYGLYWYLLECIARTVESHNLTFELEEDAELISAATGIHHERVEEMMRYMISINLFQASEGRIFCLKMADRTDEYTQKLLRIADTKGSVGTKSEQCRDKVPPNRIDKSRVEESRVDKKNGRFTPPTLHEVLAYCQEKGYQFDPERFIDFYESKGWMVGKNKMKSWKAAVRNWSKGDNGTRGGGPKTFSQIGIDRTKQAMVDFVGGEDGGQGQDSVCQIDG